jgi:hypothetical protein
MAGSTLIDDRADLTLRKRIGNLISTSSSADFAVANVRIGAIDLTHAELGRLQSCRLLVDRLDAEMLGETAEVIGLGGRLSRNLRVLHEFALSGRLHVRAAGATRWMPDFTVLRRPDDSDPGGPTAICLLGAHYFSRPVVMDGASFTCVLSDSDSVRLAAARFEELWFDGYDVLPVIRSLLQDLLDGG